VHRAVKSYGRIVMKFFEAVGRGQRIEWLDFGGDPYQNHYPEIF